MSITKTTAPQPAPIPILRPSVHHRSADPSRLAPEDAFSPPYHERRRSPLGVYDEASEGASVTGLSAVGRKRENDRGRSRSRRRKGPWKKLLWVKQPYPDNYTDEATFLDHLQRNPRLQSYEFWPLVADSTVIVQHVCSVLIFVCCFTLIFQERVSPVSVVGWGSVGTVLGWVLWDHWVGQEEAAAVAAKEKNGEGCVREGKTNEDERRKSDGSMDSGPSLAPKNTEREVQGLGLSIPSTTSTSRHGHSHSTSATSFQSATSPLVSPSAAADHPPTSAGSSASYTYYPPYASPDSILSPRNAQRLATAKSAILIVCALLALSPILKSLTMSTTEDSIWAISSVLMCINVVFFDYGGEVGAKFPAPLSTNAALMASTVLASRLPSTAHVFSLTLFSIQVFGLFPVFRRHLRSISWSGHVGLTLALVAGASGGLALTVTNGGRTAAALGVLLGGVLTGLVMGLCSWCLIDLQRYKNEISGPWDPARPVIRRGWD